MICMFQRVQTLRSSMYKPRDRSGTDESKRRFSRFLSLRETNRRCLPRPPCFICQLYYPNSFALHATTWTSQLGHRNHTAGSLSAKARRRKCFLHESHLSASYHIIQPQSRPDVSFGP